MRSPSNQTVPLKIVGSSTFGRYPIISNEKTLNMIISDDWLVPYSGYKTAINNTEFDSASSGRAIHKSTIFNRLFVVFDNFVYKVDVDFNQSKSLVSGSLVTKIGELQTSTGVVWFAENTKPQILISDNQSLYLYDETLNPRFRVLSIDFEPGKIDFHDTYFLCAARNTSTWRLSASNDGTIWNDDAASVGTLQTKPDKTKAVIPAPGKGNMIFVFGETVVEAWFDTGGQLFPYQKNTSYTIDYGCVNPATIATLDNLVVWLAINEKAGPTIMYTTGGNAEQITTDGIDYVFSNLQSPEDSQAFIYKQDGHIFYHLNFYSDNLSLVYDFNTQKIFHASDENLNYYKASKVSFFKNQNYMISKDSGNLYLFDTIFTTYDNKEIPRIRITNNIRFPDQQYFKIINSGFTIESGETNYLTQNLGKISLITQSGDRLRTDGDQIFIITQAGDFITTQDGKLLSAQQSESSGFKYLIAQQDDIVNTCPSVDYAISIDGGNQFGNYQRYNLPHIGNRRNKLMWWRLGAANNITSKFRFNTFGRVIASNGEMVISGVSYVSQ
jgi:hypothetical protein